MIALASGCASVRIESAKGLGSAGRDVTVLSAASVFASSDECQRALDAEAFFHGYAGTVIPGQLLEDYRVIQAELAARKQVFTQLGRVYEAFHALAAADAASGFEAAAGRLGDAVNGYAAVLNKPSVISNSDKDALCRIGGWVGTGIQKRKIRKASALIRERLAPLERLLEDPLVRAQLTSFKKNLSASRSGAITLLWEKGLLDASPLVTELSGDAGLKASKDAAKILSDPKTSFVKEGLSAVITNRAARRLDQLEQSYDASVKAVKELIALHNKLEAGETASLSQLRQHLAELQRAAALPAATKTTEDD